MKISLRFCRQVLLVAILPFVLVAQADTPKLSQSLMVPVAANATSLHRMEEGSLLLASAGDMQTNFTNTALSVATDVDLGPNTVSNVEQVTESSDSAMLLTGFAMLVFIVGRRKRVF